MKKQRRPSRTASKAIESPRRTPQAVALSRRNLLRRFRNGSIAVVALSLGGWGLAYAYQSHAERHDLSVIGNGIPTVVQIHDPQCPTCRALQKEALRAARAFDDSALQIRVANIRSPAGSALASRYGVPHVTLLFFDKHGEMRQVLSGLHEHNDLRDRFRTHIARSAGS